MLEGLPNDTIAKLGIDRDPNRYRLLSESKCVKVGCRCVCGHRGVGEGMGCTL
jgi:hypothetical protein